MTLSVPASPLVQQRSGSEEYRGIMHVRNGSIGKVTQVLASDYCSSMVPKWPKQDIPEGLDCIKDRRDPVAHAEVGHRSATIYHLGNIARWVSEVTGETGQRLKWDAQNEQFTNSPEGNRFLDQQRRKGFELPDRV